MRGCSNGRRMARTRQCPNRDTEDDLSRLQYFPVALPHFSLLAGIFLVVVAWIEVRQNDPLAPWAMDFLLAMNKYPRPQRRLLGPRGRLGSRYC
jgi:hypothetical protein